MAQYHDRVQLSCPDHVPPVMTDAGLAQVVLSNLLSNSIKYAAPKSVPVIEVKASETHLTVKFSNKISHPLRAPDRLTEKYFRDPSTTGKSGTGLGLYLANLLCEQLGHGLELSETTDQFTAKIKFQIA